MNITANTTVLAQELRLLNQVVAQKPALPILSNVLIHAGTAGLYLATTDLEIAFSTICRAHVEQEGRVTLPVKRLLDIVEQLPDSDVQIISDRLHVFLRSEAFNSRLQTFDAADFPTMPMVAGEVAALSTAQLQTMIRRVRYAISDKGKYTIKGALFTLTDTLAALVSTDGRRVALTTTSRRGLATSAIIPMKALDALLSMFSEPQILFSQDVQHLFFQAGERLLVSRMIEGTFPSYERVIPRENTKKAIVDRLALAAALRRVGLVSEENMACYFSFEAGVLDLASSSAQVGDASERVGITYTEEPIKVCCNWQFVLDFLEVAAGRTVTIALKDTNNPMLLTDGEDHLSVIMLLRA